MATENNGFKVGDVVASKPFVGVVYEVGWGGLRIQSANGEKHRGIPFEMVEPASEKLVKTYTANAPAELQPEAIIEREKEEHGEHATEGEDAGEGEGGEDDQEPD